MMKKTPYQHALLALAVPALLAAGSASDTRLVREQPISGQVALFTNTASAPATQYQPWWARILGLGGATIGVACCVGWLVPGSTFKQFVLFAKGRKATTVIAPSVEAAITAPIASTLLAEPAAKVEPIPPEVATPIVEQMQPVVDGNSDLDRLLAFLREQAPWLLKTIGSPIVFVGAQRSGKSSAAQAIALIRQVLMGGDIYWCHPHADKDFKEISQTIKLTGGSKNWDAMQAALTHYLTNSNTAARTTVFDELSAWDGNIPDTLVSQVWRAANSESTKMQQYPIFLCHGRTVPFRGGAKNVSDVISNMPEIEIAAATDELGKPTFSPSWTLSNFPGQDTMQVERPAWLTPKWLIETFNLPGFYTELPPDPFVKKAVVATPEPIAQGSSRSIRPIPFSPPSQPTTPPTRRELLRALFDKHKQSREPIFYNDMLQGGVVAAGERDRAIRLMQSVANQNPESWAFTPENGATNPYLEFVG